MDVFEVREQLVDDYRQFTSSFVDPRNERLAEHVRVRMDSGEQWPDPYLSLNPNFAPGGTVGELVEEGLLHPECERIFRLKQEQADPGTQSLHLYRHQREAIEAARTGESYVLTTGTGSGKSLAYLIPIVDRVVRARDEQAPGKGVKAIVVYPMNALANSQLGELNKFLTYGYPTDGQPVTFERYTGQESDEERKRILDNPPDILLTNYVMLDLVLTRPRERDHLVRAAQGLQFVVLDELHTYRGRQGADVAMLVRRLRDACAAPGLQCVGTSATMATSDSLAEERETVADVAARLFGSTVTPERVIGETLQRVTSPEAAKAPLAHHMQRSGRKPDYHEFLHDPLVSWVESTFGIRMAREDNRLVRQQPTTLQAAARQLAIDTWAGTDQCLEAIRGVLEEASQVLDPATGRPAFAFRLHQFLSKGDHVYVSLEPEDTRYITSRYQTVVPGAPEKVLVPVAFCRECGQEYLTVRKTERHGATYYQARFDNDAGGGDFATGYLFISSDAGQAWPETRDEAIYEGRLPDSWLVTDQHGYTWVNKTKEKYLPRVVHVDVGGTEVDRHDGLKAAFVPSPFPFCLRCRVSYEQRGRDFAKLATLSAEGRSSATSVISSSIVRSLKQVDDPDFNAEARKLLTFVDNRQDASLQAGHFNDFVQVTQLRGALYQAMRDADEQTLTHDDIAMRVCEKLGLNFADYAQNPEAQFGARRAAESALRDVVGYRLYQDLERGWRVTMPNLEQTGLLSVDYLDLDDIAASQETWDGCHDALRDADYGQRRELCVTMLDELRRVLAIDVDYFGQDGFERLRRQSDQHLTGPWALPEGERSPEVGAAYPRPGGRGGSRRDLYLSGQGALGRFLRREGTLVHPPNELEKDDAQQVIRDTLAVLEKCGLLTIAYHDTSGTPAYRLKSAAILWRMGDGETGAEDRLRRIVENEQGPRVNPFFLRLYREVARTLSGLHAREHTAQVPPEQRQDREKEFRAGNLPLLYCSPTMELGVDIASLNAVALRNVPPTPANYAQRSGRAGRSGQPALVTTYCATGNAHDQYYFRNARHMVAGSVAPPRLDLTNEDLLRSHVHAIWLAETGQDLHQSLAELIDLAGDEPTLDLLPEVRATMNDAHAQRRAVRRAWDLLSGIVGELADTSWYHDGWLEEVVNAAPESFDRACDRWRDLYRAALVEREKQHQIIGDLSASKLQRNLAQGRRRDAETQLRLLRNEDSDRSQTDFYSYRYFASEGFLPGYSFPRLPLAAYVPGMRGARGSDGDYVQRPRFLAVREFGPGALIYHEGARYEVKYIQLPPTQPGQNAIETQQARTCQHCGYLHDKDVGVDVCDLCGATLGATTYNLLRLQTVFTRRRERISSDEEERRRAGFELTTSYRFTEHGHRPGRVDASASDATGQLLELSYGDTATVRVTNKGRKRRKNPTEVGYWLDTVNGEWLSERKAADHTPEDDSLAEAEDVQTKQKVIPYVEDRRNILITRLPHQVSAEAAGTLMFALSRGIGTAFQLEESELDCELLPDPDHRGRALFIESAEGGAGVLRRLVDEPGALATAARYALELAHFDPNTGEDTEGRDSHGERCERACYDCLLSYRNQQVHEQIDRHLVRDQLLALAGAETIRGSGGVSRDEQLDHLLRACDSELERQFVQWLRQHNYRLPDEAQRLVRDAGTRVDFVYQANGGNVAVFVDGPHHEADRAAQRDAEAEERLYDLGWSVVRVAHDADWASVIQRYPSVFGPS
ncbi:protein of unknown function [Haloechinothrix alba]|uniref:ATP-dependent helicase YprA, contains C-terminal metal-binding DUF1998 domain n=1 Tax=Haloechinothrix alba TaxID=664784 RepID=A0A238WKL9_9PSEU|nr:DEAD/DEAH box helicase [Haloechinothrix alba]SNR46794.1 protein of unknown function [Haloechinothrix alba]